MQEKGETWSNCVKKASDERRQEERGESSMSTTTSAINELPPELRELQVEIEGHARGYGLDCYDTIFEILDYDELSEIAALGGFPTRYPHWRFGMQYEQLSKGYRYGLQKIYEMVINNDPCYAYLLRCNQMVDQKLVMAHVYGHNDFFKNNIAFSRTNRKMMDETANHGNRIRRYMERYGEDEVEDFIDSCLSLENLIDIHSPFIKRRDETSRYDFRADQEAEPTGAGEVTEQEGVHGFVHQSARVSAGGVSSPSGGARGDGEVVSRAAGAGCAAVFARACVAETLAARRVGDHPGGSVLLRASGRDEDHERRLGVLLAFEDHDDEVAGALGGGGLRGPSFWNDGGLLGPAESVQAGNRAVAGYRGAVGQGAIWSRVGRL